MVPIFTKTFNLSHVPNEIPRSLLSEKLDVRNIVFIHLTGSIQYRDEDIKTKHSYL